MLLLVLHFHSTHHHEKLLSVACRKKNSKSVQSRRWPMDFMQFLGAVKIGIRVKLQKAHQSNF